MTKVHIILNAHLDPIWLWSWRDGLDEVLNTSRYICDLLDRHPDIIYTRGEAWVYEQVRRIDPALFARIAVHIREGRWSTVGGWYIQPDCNQPSGFALERQIALGHRMFSDYFGHAPAVGYNVDSFGHAATLPGYLRHAGQHSYVMMRPQEHELALPARLFRWRGYEDGPEVTTFRIAHGYCTPEGLTEEHIRAAASELPPGVTHTMCFVGIGDHGGGPTEEMLAWVRKNRTALPGLELVFSSPDKFFAALAPELGLLPLVTGELQMHAIGCYTVHRPVKTALRRAEHKLVQAEMSLAESPDSAEEFAPVLETAWKQVCFHHFHDTLGGTCLPSAYADVDAQLGRALAIADEINAISLRRRVVTLPDDPAQRIILCNASDLPFDDFAEVEPWLEWTKWQPNWQLRDEADQPVPYQAMRFEALAGDGVRLFFPLSLHAGAQKILRIVEPKIPVPIASRVEAVGATLRAREGAALRLDGDGGLELPALGALPLPQLVLCDDATDTWSHGVDRYAPTNRQLAAWQPPQAVDQGPLMASLLQSGAIGGSRLRAEWRVYADRPWVELFLRVLWQEEKRLLKLEVTAPAEISAREDGILGGSLTRQPDGRELPLRDWTRLQLRDGGVLAVVAPDVYALDGSTSAVGLTLLRSPLMAWHDPDPGTNPRGVYSDRGEHAFRFRFLAAASAAELDRMAFGLQRPPLSAEGTRGMKTRALRSSYAPPLVD